MKRKDGNYTQTFTYEGKRYYVYAKKKSDLADMVSERKQQLQEQALNRANPKFAEYSEEWQRNRVGIVSENTLRTNAHSLSAIAQIMIPAINAKFGDIRMRNITLEDVRSVQNELLKTRSTRTVNDYIALLRHIFSDARKERVIEENPTDMVRQLKRKEEAARDTYHRALSVEETGMFFRAARGDYYYNVYRMAIQTGMRVGEIGALRLSDIFDDSIHVERTITVSTLIA